MDETQKGEHNHAKRHGRSEPNVTCLFISMKSPSASLKGLWADDRTYVGRERLVIPTKGVNVADCTSNVPTLKDVTFR